MNNGKIDTIIFDLGGVLIDWNPEYLFRKIFEDEDELYHFLSNITTPDWNEQQDAGRPLAEATEWLVERHPQYETEIRAYYGRWTEMLGGAIEGTAHILRRLKAQGSHRLYALTNWSHETFPIALERFDFLGLFEGILVSGEERMKKPDLAIYELILERYDINPATTLFIDDSKRNIEGAEKAGLKTIHFESPVQLEQALEERGILNYTSRGQ